MSETSVNTEWSEQTQFGAVKKKNLTSRFSSEFLKTGKPFLTCYCIGLFTFLISFPVASITGNQPDIATVSNFASVLGLLLMSIVVIAVIAKFIHISVVEKPNSPSIALGKWCLDQVSREQRFLNLLHMLIMISLFLLGFAVLKGAIAILNPFSWDLQLRDWDKALHFGYFPHEWLNFIVDNPAAVSFFNFFYNLWFFILLSSLIIAGIFVSRSAVHMRYLISFLLIWLVAGFFIATGFSSAGPCFFGRAGFGDDYQPLMAQLNLAAQTNSVWAVATQNLLWDGFSGARDGSVGISAFPSIHVASATSIALYTSSISRTGAVLGWIFAALIMIGSVVLGWHYAVDGYAGATMAVIIWKLAPKLLSEPSRLNA